MLPDSALAALKESDRADIKPALEALVLRHGHEPVNVAMMIASQTTQAPNPFARGSITAADLPAAEEPVRLWFGMYPRSVVLFIGETGAGKSSLIYNWCIHAARNEPLWGVPFGAGRPIRVLYIDPENSGNYSEGQGGQCAVKIERIGQGRPVDLVFHDGQGVDLANPLHMAALKEWIEAQRFDVVILDPIANLFGTKDENDNAEAARQMTALTSLSRSTGACIIAVHHTGKGGTSDYGRGASARLGAADVAFVFRAKGETEEVDDTFNGELREREDQCRLQIVKNRLEGRGSLYLQMTGQDRFTLSNFEGWKAARSRADGKTSKMEQAQEEIKLYLSDGIWHPRAEIVEAMAKEGIGQINTDAALKALELADVIASKKHGRSGMLKFILTSVIDADVEDGRFVVLQSPKDITKLQSVEEAIQEKEKELDNKFFNPPDQPNMPYKDDDNGGWVE